MGLFGGLKRERTKVIAERILEVEVYLWCLARAVLGRLQAVHAPDSADRQNPNEMMAAASAALDRDRRMGALAGAGMAQWGTLTIQADEATILRQLSGIADRAGKFRGSTGGMTDTGKAVVEHHFQVLESLSKTTGTAVVMIGNGQGASACKALDECAEALGRQVEDARRVIETH